MSDIAIQSNPQSFSFELIRESSIKQKEYCSAVAIDKNNQLVLATADKAIKVFSFKMERLKQIQQLNMNKMDVTTLNWFLNKSQFINGSIDSTIRISSTNVISSAKYFQQLKGHQSWITNIIIHPKNQDVIISSSNDSSIRVWQNIENWQCCQIIQDYQKDIKGLSINQEGDQLCSCSGDQQILILKPINNKNYFKWQVNQIIMVDQSGYRICSINDKVFTFQQDSNNYLHIYTKDQNGLFSKTGQIKVAGGEQSCDYLFPSVYHSSKQLLINKNGYTINLIRIFNKNDSNDQINIDFILEQIIDFGDQSYGHIWGTLSQDQKYLITWDCDSSEIQIRKYTEKL
ncbi:unnamed protein product [Paramecium sonneborni]|uniref:Uncharacterized protein n=1 Tax=Paramecium sonneborni TaxID=65129 RepID=A0A8S1LAX4_9CILI|nr:unnamed protein product [Paramecium sonneborni]